MVGIYGRMAVPGMQMKDDEMEVVSFREVA
jgi:hypothetical protein